MTSLTDKMEKLRKDTPNELDIGSERSTPKIIRDNGFNQGVEASIALAKAEEAVVGQTLEEAYDIGKKDGLSEEYQDGYFAGATAERKIIKAEEAVVGEYLAPTVLTDEQMRPGQEVEQYLRTHGHLPGEVVGDWEADHKDFYWEQGEHEGRKLGFESHVAFIKKLLAAKDRDIAEAYAQGWNEGQIDLSARLKI